MPLFALVSLIELLASYCFIYVIIAVAELFKILYAILFFKASLSSYIHIPLKSSLRVLTLIYIHYLLFQVAKDSQVII